MRDFSDYWQRLLVHGPYGYEFNLKAQQEHYRKYKAMWEEIGSPKLYLHRDRKYLLAHLDKHIPVDGPITDTDAHCFNTGNMHEVDSFGASCPRMIYTWSDGKRWYRSSSEHVCVSKWYALHVICGFPPPPDCEAP